MPTPVPIETFTTKRPKVDPNASADMNAVQASIVTIETALNLLVNTNGSLVQGTSFPGSPVAGQIIWRTDLKQFYIYDGVGAAWVLINVTGAIPTNMQIFQSSGTWTRPAGVVNVWAQNWGPGGAAGDDGGGGHGAGGGGSYAEGLIAVTGNVTVTIGAAGTSGNPGAAAGATTFAGTTTLTANGGGSNSGNTGGSGGTASNGSINLTGQPGITGVGSNQAGGFSNGPQMMNNTSVAISTTQPYVGQGCNSGSSKTAGPGLCIVRWAQ